MRLQSNGGSDPITTQCREGENGLVTPIVDQFTWPTADLHVDLEKIFLLKRNSVTHLSYLSSKIVKHLLFVLYNSKFKMALIQIYISTMDQGIIIL